MEPVRPKNSASSRKRRILLVDDHKIIREALTELINRQDDLVVCCEAANAREALSAAAKGKPDLIVTDISLDGESGLELIKDTLAVQPGVRVLVLSMHDESIYSERALRAGARGYIMKRLGGEAILAAIRAVLDGRVHVSPEMSAQILNRFNAKKDRVRRTKIQSLTDREFEVFELLGKGRSPRQIAAGLRISLKTVAVYRQRLKEKLQSEDSSSLISKAVRWVETEGRG